MAHGLSRRAGAHRAGGSADANPYIALAAALGAGLLGIEGKLQPTPIVKGNAYAQNFPDSLRFPGTLWDAAQRLKASSAARALLLAARVEIAKLMRGSSSIHLA